MPKFKKIKIKTPKSFFFSRGVLFSKQKIHGGKCKKKKKKIKQKQLDGQ
jgi:hypothetical protein